MGGKISNASQIAVEYILCNINDEVIKGIKFGAPSYDVSI
jgi:hypothetical protein